MKGRQKEVYTHKIRNKCGKHDYDNNNLSQIKVELPESRVHGYLHLMRLEQEQRYRVIQDMCFI